MPTLECSSKTLEEVIGMDDLLDDGVEDEQVEEDTANIEVQMAVVPTDLVHGDPVHVEIGSLGRRFKRLSAAIRIHADVDKVWHVLTEYENLPTFIPNLARCERLEHPDGGIRLLQVGEQTLLYIHFEAQVVLDLIECRRDGELHFSMIDGDFHVFRGRWRLSRIEGAEECTLLEYSVDVRPKMFLPLAFVSTIIRKDLPANLVAIRQRAEALCAVQESVYAAVLAAEPDAALLQPITSALEPSACSLSDLSVCLESEAQVESYKKGSFWYRRISAGFLISADLKSIWSVLTDYEGLRNYVPNLARSELLPAPDNKIRLLQVGVKYQLYFQFQARALLDVVEIPHREIRFTMLQGDFEEFTGKWTIKQQKDKRYRVEYAVDVRPKGSIPFGVVEKIIRKDLPVSICAVKQQMERVDELRKQEAAVAAETQGPTAPAVKRRPQYWLDVNNLEKELRDYIQTSGSSQAMPKYWTLRKAGRNDLVKAIAMHGGFSQVAKKLKLGMAYVEKKPWGYWDKFSNIEKELMSFIEKYGTPGVMPTRAALRAAGRYDLANATDRYGGFVEVAHLLGLKLSRPKKRTNHARRDTQDDPTIDSDAPVSDSDPIPASASDSDIDADGYDNDYDDDDSVSSSGMRSLGLSAMSSSSSSSMSGTSRGRGRSEQYGSSTDEERDPPITRPWHGNGNTEDHNGNGRNH